MAGNEATLINKTSAGISITSHGSDWYWTCFSVFGLFALIHASIYLVFHKSSSQERRNKAIYHIGALASNSVLAFAYFTLASNLGYAPVAVEFNHIDIGDDTRQVFYARYIGWFLAYPGLLYTFEVNSLAQNILSKSDYLQLFQTLFLQVCSTEVFVLGLLVGSVIHSSYKWGYWTFAVASGLFMITILFYHQFRTASKTSLTTKLLVPLFSLCFILYPVCWGLSEGGNVIQPDSEGVFYGVLDLINFWLIPLALIYDSYKHGTVINEAHLPTRGDDVEKQTSPELRASGETEVGNQENPDEGALETQHA